MTNPITSADNPKKQPKIFKYRNLIPLWIAVFIDIIGFSLIMPFAPELQDIYGVDQITIGMVLSINAFFSFIFGPILGRLSDKFGRRPLLLISQFGTFLGFILLAFSSTLWMLVLSRIIDGIFGGNFPIAKAVISDSVPPKDRGIQMANIGIAHILASLICPGIGSFLFVFGQLLATGFFAAGLSIITMFVTVFLLKETWPKEKRESHQIREQKLDVKLRKNKNALFMLTLWAFHAISFMIIISSFSFYGRDVIGLDPLEIGFLLTISGLLRAGIRFTVFKPTIKKLGETRAIQLGLVLLLISYLTFGFSTGWVMLFITIIILSYGASITRGPLNSKITQSVSPQIQGKINGVGSSFDSIAQILGPLVGTFFLQFFAPFWLGIVIALVALPATVMAFLNLDKRKWIPDEDGRYSL